MTDLEHAAAAFLGCELEVAGSCLLKREFPATDADLLLALLMRAAELPGNVMPVLWKHPTMPVWYFKLWPKGRDVYYEYTVIEEGPTPLQAVLAAVVKYQEGKA